MAKKKPTDVVIDCSEPLKNAKHELFCREYMVDLNATRAYRAVYKCSTKTAEVNGCNLLRNTKVDGRLTHLKEDIAVELGMNSKQAAKRFLEIADRAKSKPDLTNELRAMENLGKYLGIYEKDKKQIVDGFAEIIKEICGCGSGLPIGKR